MVRRDFRMSAAIDDAQRTHTHALIADANAAVAQDAARGIEKDYWRPLLLVDMQLLFHEAAFARAVAEHHVLQLAFAALIAHRAIQRMIREQEFERSLAGLTDRGRFGMHHHALGHRQRAPHLQLGRLLHLYQTHAASGLQRQPVVIAK